MSSAFQSYAGKLLVSHPLQRDKNFCESVVLIHSHSLHEGAMGVIINHPCHKKLGETQSEFSSGPLASLPIHIGGPVGANQLAFGSWKFPVRGPAALRFGFTVEEAAELMQIKDYHLTAYVGYAGWSPGQLENEIKLQAWVVCPFERSLSQFQGRELWKNLLARNRPDIRLILESPADPGLN